MGKKHKKHKPEWRTVDDCEDKPFEKQLKLVLKVGGSEITELSGSGHDSSYYDDRSDHERERHKDKKKKKKKKSEKEKDKHVDDEERRRRKEEKKRKRERSEMEPEVMDHFHPNIKVEVEQQGDRPVRACRTAPEFCLSCLSRKDAHGFFTFPVTDAIAPGYSVIIKHPMDFSTMNDKITDNEYKTVTEFKADFKLMCDNAMVYNRPETVYYKAAKKLLHTGFKMMSKQAAILGDEDVASEEPPPEVIPMPVESASAKKSKKQPKDIKDMKEVISCYLYEPEGNACSLTDSTAEEHVLALVEHAADEAHDRINRYMPNSKMGYLRKEPDGNLLYTVVNQLNPEAKEEETHPVDLSSLSNKLLPGLTTLGFKDDRRHKVTFLSSTYNTQTLQNNSIYPDLLPDEMDLLYSAYGDETGVQCALSIQEFVKGCGNVTKRLVDGLLDKMTAGDHSKAVYQIRQGSSVLDFMSMKSYSDMSLEMSMLNSLGKSVKKEPEHEDGVSQQHFEEAAKLLQEFQEGQVERGGSRPSSNLSSLSGTSDRDQHHLGSPSHLGVGDQSEMVHDPYEFLQSPEPGSTSNS
uniref:Bromodomain-containing protein 9 n=1 Tax=Salmo trutta TaxID=8032 RepID=A0A674AR50_SALTR